MSRRKLSTLAMESELASHQKVDRGARVCFYTIRLMPSVEDRLRKKTAARDSNGSEADSTRLRQRSKISTRSSSALIIWLPLQRVFQHTATQLGKLEEVTIVALH